jgi:hypothetical protein
MLAHSAEYGVGHVAHTRLNRQETFRDVSIPNLGGEKLRHIEADPRGDIGHRAEVLDLIRAV